MCWERATNKKQALPLGARHSDGALLVDPRAHERHLGGGYSALSGALAAHDALFGRVSAYERRSQRTAAACSPIIARTTDRPVPVSPPLSSP